MNIKQCLGLAGIKKGDVVVVLSDYSSTGVKGAKEVVVEGAGRKWVSINNSRNAYAIEDGKSDTQIGSPQHLVTKANYELIKLAFEAKVKLKDFGVELVYGKHTPQQVIEIAYKLLGPA